MSDRRLLQLWLISTVYILQCYLAMFSTGLYLPWDYIGHSWYRPNGIRHRNGYMLWHQMGARPSATTMLTKLYESYLPDTNIMLYPLTHWGRVTHICVSKLTIIGSDNGLSPGRRQAIIWTNAGILLVRTLGTNFSEILSEIHAFSFKEIHLKISSAK